MSNIKILIVEDDELVASYIGLHLKRWGYISSIVTSGKDAIQKVKEDKPDLILMDIKLSNEVDGIETAHQIRSQYDIPIVYVTAYFDDELLRRAKISEPYSYLVKPIKINELHATVDIALYKASIDRQLKKSIEEKELLMRELQHRVKNNLAVIYSLLSMEENKLTDIKAKEVFEDAKSRIKSLSLIYEKLYQSKSLININLGAYIVDLVEDIYKTYNISKNKINISYSISDIFIDLKQAVPVGLILNELVTNALKYAFPENMIGTIEIKLYKDNENIILIFSDNGIGLPANFDIKNVTSMGLGIVKIMVEQMDGRIEVKSDKGTEFCITIPNFCTE